MQLSKSPLLSTFPTKALYVTKHQHYSDVDIDFDNAAAADDDDDDDDSTSDQLQVLILHSLFTLSPLSPPPSLRAKLR